MDCRECLDPQERREKVEKSAQWVLQARSAPEGPRAPVVAMVLKGCQVELDSQERLETGVNLVRLETPDTQEKQDPQVLKGMLERKETPGCPVLGDLLDQEVRPVKTEPKEI